MAIMVVPVCKLSWFAHATCATIAHATLWARWTDEAMNDGPVHAGWLAGSGASMARERCKGSHALRHGI